MPDCVEERVAGNGVVHQPRGCGPVGVPAQEGVTLVTRGLRRLQNRIGVVELSRVDLLVVVCVVVRDVKGIALPDGVNGGDTTHEQLIQAIARVGVGIGIPANKVVARPRRIGWCVIDNVRVVVLGVGRQGVSIIWNVGDVERIRTPRSAQIQGAVIRANRVRGWPWSWVEVPARPKIPTCEAVTRANRDIGEIDSYRLPGVVNT